MYNIFGFYKFKKITNLKKKKELLDNYLKQENFRGTIILSPEGVNGTISFKIDRYISIRKNIKKFDGFVALGCVIKGQTPHFDLICYSTFNSILSLSTNYNKPIGNGIITAYNMKQALQRCKGTQGKKPNKGSEAANAVMSILQNGPKKI